MGVLTYLTVPIHLSLGSRHETVTPTLRADRPTSIKSSTKIPHRYTYRPTWSRQSFFVKPSLSYSRSCQTVNFSHCSSLLYLAESHILSSNFLHFSPKLVLFILKCKILFKSFCYIIIWVVFLCCYVSGYVDYMCVCPLCVCIAQGDQKRAHNPQRLELKIVMSPKCLLVNQTPVLWKSRC